MRSAVTHIGLAGMSFLVGMSVYSCAATDIPDARVAVVEKPVVKTHVVHETEYVTVPLPDSCETFVDMVQLVTDAASDVNRSGTAITVKAQEITPAIMQDPRAVNEFNIFFVDAKNDLDDALIVALENNERLAYRLQVCKDDIQLSNDGEHVDPLDGQSGVTP